MLLCPLLNSGTREVAAIAATNVCIASNSSEGFHTYAETYQQEPFLS